MARIRSAAPLAAFGASMAALVALSCGSFSEADPLPSGDAGGAEVGTGDGACATPRYCDCQAGATFCADFDGADVAFEWDVKRAEGGGSLIASPSDRSAPNALRSTTPPSTGGSANARATLTQSVAGDVASFSLSFDFALRQLCASGSEQVSFASVSGKDAAGKSNSFAFGATASGLGVFTNSGPSGKSALQSLSNAKKWTRVVMDVTAGTLVVTFDGVSAGAPVPLMLMSQTFDVVLGVDAAGVSGACEAEYDNVVVRVR